VPADEQGRIDVDALNAELDRTPAVPTIVCLQAGNLHSGAFDPFTAAITAAHRHDAWVHIDGAFGLWAGASDRLRALVAGYEAADSWATDAHKTLNVPYDCSIAIVAHPADLRAALGMHADYLIEDAAGDPLDFVPEMSRRARGVPVWAALRSLGRSGVATLVDGLVTNAQSLAAGLAKIAGVQVLDDVVYTQVSIAFGDDERTKAVEAELLAGGVTWMSGSRWRARQVIRVSVSNWATDNDDVTRSIQAVREAVRRVDSRQVAY
jgi:glutamate/tyrosine decarboxylase-like PLP-dependent enzyme